MTRLRATLRVTTLTPLAPCTLLAAALLIRLVGAWHGVPIISGDQALFLPVARQLRESGELVHPFLSVSGEAPHLYNWHGWLFPIVLSWFPTSGEARTILFGATAIAALSVVPTIAYAVIARLGLAATATLVTLIGAVAMYQIGRPESLATFFWCSAILAQRRLSGARFDVVAAIALALIAITQPTVAVAAALVFAAHAACTSVDGRELTRHVGLVAAISAPLVLALTSACSPLTLEEWYRGLRDNAAYIAARTDGGPRELLRYFVLQPSLLAVALHLVLFTRVAAGARSLARTPLLRRAYGASVLLLTLFIVLTAVRIPATVYNFVALIPNIAAIAVSSRHQRCTRWVLNAATAAAAVSLVFTSASVIVAARGTSVLELQATLQRIHPCAIAPDPSSWLAVSEAIGVGPICRANEPCASRIIVQANSGLLRPPAELGGQKLRLDHFHRERPSLGGFPVGRTSKDYAFAIYGDPTSCAGRDATTLR